MIQKRNGFLRYICTHLNDKQEVFFTIGEFAYPAPGHSQLTPKKVVTLTAVEFMQLCGLVFSDLIKQDKHPRLNNGNISKFIPLGKELVIPNSKCDGQNLCFLKEQSMDTTATGTATTELPICIFGSTLFSRITVWSQPVTGSP